MAISSSLHHHKMANKEQIFSLLPQMDALQPQSPQGIGSVKAAIGLYGERVLGGKPDKINGQIFPQEDLPWKTRELHQAKADISRLNETKNSAERERERAESELSQARIMAKGLASRIEESNARARAQRSELQPMRKMEKKQEDLEHDSVLQELDKAKKELSRLKLDVASAMEAKTKAEKESEACSSKAMAYSRSVAELKKKVDEADEEHVLVELARMEAEREFRDTEARRAAEADQFAKSIETAKKRIKELRRELNRSKDLEMKLRITNSEMNVLQGEMELVRAMERSYQTDLASKANKKREDSDAKTALESAEAELKAAKQELATIKEESFQFMISMDQIREELIRTAAETSGLKKLEKRAETNIEHLNSKLLKAKSKLEAATVAEERAKAIVSNLSAALQQMQTETETAKKEKQLIDEETKSIRAEIDKTDSAIRSAEERLYTSMEELEAVKASEAMALRKLSNVAQRTMRNRALSIPHSSSVTISRSEFEYLGQQAAAAQVIATKKVEAAQAWVEALAAEEKEILMKAEFIEKEIRRSRTGEVKELHKTQKSSAVEEEPNELGQSEEEEENAVPAKPRKSTRENGMAASSRRVTVRRLSTSSATRNARSPSFTIKKRKKVMPNLLKFLGDRRNRKQKV